MPRIKLTEKALARLKAPTANGKQIVYWDAELTGFGVLCSGVSNARSFVAQRDLPSGKTRRVTIAAASEMALADARREAAAVLVDMRRGLDPKAERRGAVTLKGALDAYLAARTDLKPRSVSGYRVNIERWLSDWLDLRLADITREMVESRLRRIAADVAAGESGGAGHATANIVMRSLRAVYNYAAERGPLPPNPVKLRRLWFKVEPRTRLVTDEQLPRFYAAVWALPNEIHRDYILLLLFTGLRRREAAELRWTEVDIPGGVIRLPASRTKAGRRLDLPMSDFVRDLLIRRRAIGKMEFVFPANSRSGCLAEPRFALRQVAAACGVEVSAHDLRRSFVTAAESTDVSVLALRALINHSIGGGVTEGYVQMTVERLRVPMQRVTDRIKALCEVPEPEGVLALNK